MIIHYTRALRILIKRSLLRVPALDAATVISLIIQKVDVILGLLRVKEKGVFARFLGPFAVLPFSVATDSLIFQIRH